LIRNAAGRQDLGASAHHQVPRNVICQVVVVVVVIIIISSSRIVLIGLIVRMVLIFLIVLIVLFVLAVVIINSYRVIFYSDSGLSITIITIYHNISQ
jgi:hypothetical protein